MKRIICVGNRHRPEDAAGSMVFDRLVQVELPADVEVIDGALGGLDLLRFVEGARRVVFVDAVSGFETENGLVVLTAEQAVRDAAETYDHAAGLIYLLSVFRQVSDDPAPEVYLVGIQGRPAPEAIAAAVELSLSIAVEGYRVRCEPVSPVAGAGP